MTDEDFCVIHGRDFMKCDHGPIPYCAECGRQAELVELVARTLARDDKNGMTYLDMADGVIGALLVAGALK